MTAFGIDLGTTNSCIAYVDESGRPVIAKNAVGENTTPSAVYFEGPDRVVVGSAAKNAALLAPHLVAQLIKREMGRQDRVFTYHRHEHTPETISAFILRELARSAGEEVGETVRDVVITVPAYFGVAEREATRRAGQIADLNVLDVLAEPVAAALSHRDQHATDGVRHLLVYDLGGGTFDTTVIRIDGDDVTVICTDGDRHLGGTDWDKKIRKYLLDAFTAQHPRLDPSADEPFMQELALAAEDMKKELSSALTWHRNLRFGGTVARGELSRAQLEQLTSELLDRTLTITNRTIEEARRQGVTDLDEMILVGGMTRMPAVAVRLEERFGLEVRRHEPDLAVARGAALFALICQARRAASDSGRAEDVAGRLGISADQAEAMIRTQVTAVVPRGFGVKVIDPDDPMLHTNPLKARYHIVHLLPANTPLPADTGPVRFSTGIDNQPMVEVDVWEQAGAVASEELADNNRIGRGRLRLPLRLPAGSPFDITFSMSETGLLTVHAVEPGSGRQMRLDLQIGGMDQAAVDNARAAVARHKVSS